MSLLETQPPITASKLIESELSNYDVEQLMYGFGLVKYLVSWVFVSDLHVSSARDLITFSSVNDLLVSNITYIHNYSLFAFILIIYYVKYKIIVSINFFKFKLKEKNNHENVSMNVRMNI